MSPKTLTTKEVARLCRVSDATVKRWEESGLIHSERTSGGHRRFRVEEVARFQQTSGLGSKHCHGDESVLTAASRRRLNKSHSNCNFFHAIVAGCEQEATDILVSKYLNHTPLTEIFDELISPALSRVGELWRKGELNVAQEHIAVRTTVSALYKFRNMLPLSESKNKLVTCSTIDGDFHELSTYLAQMTFEHHGFEVINFGAGIPFHSLLEEVLYYSPAFICITATAVSDIERLTHDYEEFRQKTAKLGIPVILGGKAFQHKNMTKLFPAEVYARSFTHLGKFLISQEKSRVKSQESEKIQTRESRD